MPRRASLWIVSALAVTAGAACNAIFGIESPDGTAPAPSSYRGDFVWARTDHGQGVASAHGIAFSPDGRVVANGTFNGQVAFGNYDLPVAPMDTATHPYVASWSDKGEHAWSTSFVPPMGGTGEGAAFALAVDLHGNTYSTGDFRGQMNADGTLLETNATFDAYLMKLGTDGTLKWAQSFPDMATDGDQLGLAIATDTIDCNGNPGDSIVWLGAGFGGINVSGQTLGGDGFWLYVVRMDGNGALCWAKGYAAGELDSMFNDVISEYPHYYAHHGGVVVNDRHEIVIATVMPDTADFHDPKGTGLVSRGAADIALVKLDANGNTIYSENFGGDDPDPSSNGNQWANAIALAPNRDVFIAGAFQSSVRFGTAQGEKVISSISPKDPSTVNMFVARIAGDTGEPLWYKAFGEEGVQQVVGLASDPFGNVALIGFSGSGATSTGVDFGGGPLRADTGMADGGPLFEDVLFAKLDGNGAHLWSRRWGDPQVQIGFGVALSATSDTAVAGLFIGTLELAKGNAQATLQANVPGAAFIGRLGP